MTKPQDPCDAVPFWAPSWVVPQIVTRAPDDPHAKDTPPQRFEALLDAISAKNAAGVAAILSQPDPLFHQGDRWKQLWVATCVNMDHTIVDLVLKSRPATMEPNVLDISRALQFLPMNAQSTHADLTAAKALFCTILKGLGWKGMPRDSLVSVVNGAFRTNEAWSKGVALQAAAVETCVWTDGSVPWMMNMGSVLEHAIGSRSVAPDVARMWVGEVFLRLAPEAQLSMMDSLIERLSVARDLDLMRDVDAMMHTFPDLARLLSHCVAGWRVSEPLPKTTPDKLGYSERDLVRNGLSVWTKADGSGAVVDTPTLAHVAMARGQAHTLALMAKSGAAADISELTKTPAMMMMALTFRLAQDNHKPARALLRALPALSAWRDDRGNTLAHWWVSSVHAETDSIRKFMDMVKVCAPEWLSATNAKGHTALEHAVALDKKRHAGGSGLSKLMSSAWYAGLQKGILLDSAAAPDHGRTLKM